MSIYSREFGSEQKYLRCIIDPDQNDHEGSGRPIGDADIVFAEIQADEELSNREQKGRHTGPNPDIVPRNRCVWEQLIDHGEQERDDRKRHEEINDVQEKFWGRKNMA